MQTKQHAHGALIILPILLAAGVIAYGLTLSSSSCTLYFPDQHATNLVRERRVLSPIGNPEERSRRVLDELALGPMNHKLQPLLPNGAQIRLVMQRSGTLYVDIELANLADSKIRFPLIKEAIEKSLKTSVPGSDSIKLFINGIETSK